MILDGFPQINVLGAAVAPTFGTFKRSAGVPLPWEPRNCIGCHRRHQITLLGQEHVDDLSVLVDGPIDLPLRPGDLYVCLIHESVAAHAVPTRSGRDASFQQPRPSAVWVRAPRRHTRLCSIQLEGEAERRSRHLTTREAGPDFLPGRRDLGRPQRRGDDRHVRLHRPWRGLPKRRSNAEADSAQTPRRPPGGDHRGHADGGERRLNGSHLPFNLALLTQFWGDLANGVPVVHIGHGLVG